jgi:dTMP kinase
MLITFEGIDGSGKTTQVARLKKALQLMGYLVDSTREPGGTEFAEELRKLIFQSNISLEQFLLFCAARINHSREFIAPMLKKGHIVICDRYDDSTRVYQWNYVNIHNSIYETYDFGVPSWVMPSLTFIFDLPAKVAKKRVEKRGNLNSFDEKEVFEYDIIRESFRNIYVNNTERCVLIDANRNEEVIAEEVLNITLQRLLKK